MEISSLGNYTTLIQLISAVNFAYIFTLFHQRVYEAIFDEKKLIDDHFTSFTNDMAVDVETLESMTPLETTNGQTNAQKLNSLKTAYDDLKDKWTVQKEKMTNLLQRVKNVKGMKSLFLFVSLFCLVDLFNIGNIQWRAGGFCELFFVVFNLCSAIVPAMLTYRVLFFMWESKSEVSCYKWTSWAFIITVFLAFVATLIQYKFIRLDLPAFLYYVSACLSIAIPFYACLFSIIYVWGYELRIKHLVGHDTEEVRQHQKKLHEEKMKVDESYRMFSSAPPDFN